MSRIGKNVVNSLMNLLIAAATETEVAPLIQHLKEHWEAKGNRVFLRNNLSVTLHVTGVGMVAVTYSLTRLLQHQRFDLALLAGISGSFDKSLPLTALVSVASEMFGDMGAEDAYSFLDIFELGLAEATEFPFQQKKLLATPAAHPLLAQLRQVSSLTVNTVAGTTFTALSRWEHFQCDLESMEGAAFHYVCLRERQPFAQVRSVSNYVETRDKSKWKIQESVATLNKWLTEFIYDLSGME